MDLISRAIARDETAARDMVEKLYPLVIKIVRAHRPQRLAEEDLCQEIFLHIFQSLPQYRAQVPFEHWVSRVSVHRCIDQLRRQRARPEWRLADLSAAERDTVIEYAQHEKPLHELPASAARELVHVVLQSMDPQDRWLVQNLEIYERSVKDVAQEMRWSVTMTKVRAYRARQKMRHLLETLYAHERV